MPYIGIMPIEITIDHTGPMTATVEDNALLLEAMVYQAARAFEQAGDWREI